MSDEQVIGFTLKMSTFKALTQLEENEKTGEKDIKKILLSKCLSLKKNWATKFNY